MALVFVMNVDLTWSKKGLLSLPCDILLIRIILRIVGIGEVPVQFEYFSRARLLLIVIGMWVLTGVISVLNVVELVMLMILLINGLLAVLVI